MGAHLLGAEGLHLEYPTRAVLDRVTLGVNEGDRIGVVGRNDDDSHVRNRRSTRPHGRKGFMSRRIKESDWLSVDFYHICTDMLCDTAGLSAGNICLSYSVKK